MTHPVRVKAVECGDSAGKRCAGPCALPDIARIGSRWRCAACGYEYIATNRWKAVGPLWEPVWAVESARPEGDE